MAAFLPLFFRLGAGPHMGAASICRGAAPAWVCDSFGYADRAAVSVVTPAPSHYIGESFDAPPSTYGAPSNPGSPRPYQPTNEPSTPTPDTSPPATPRPSRSDHTPPRDEAADATPSPTLIAKEPGERGMSQVAHTYGLTYGGVDGERGRRFGALLIIFLDMLMPSLVCLALLLDSAHSTTIFAANKFKEVRRFSPQARRSFGLGLPKGPPRDTVHLRRTTREQRRWPHPLDVHTSSRFLSTLGEAPPWLSLCLLIFEIGTTVVPCLAALSKDGVRRRFTQRRTERSYRVSQLDEGRLHSHLEARCRRCSRSRRKSLLI